MYVNRKQTAFKQLVKIAVTNREYAKQDEKELLKILSLCFKDIFVGTAQNVVHHPEDAKNYTNKINNLIYMVIFTVAEEL